MDEDKAASVPERGTPAADRLKVNHCLPTENTSPSMITRGLPSFSSTLDANASLFLKVPVCSQVS
jgi:hypothetical protein